MSELMSVMGRSGELTMSSRDIAGLVGARHSDVMRSIGRLMDSGAIKGYAPAAYTHEQNGARYQEYLIGKRDSYVVVAQLSPEFTARLVDRWQELEGQLVSTTKLPTSFAEALRLAAEQAERIEEQQAKLALAAPKVEFVDRYVEASGLQNISTVAKMLNYGPIKFSRLLESDGILYRSGGALVPKQEHIDKGRFALKTGEANGHSWMQTKVTATGVDWLANRYASEVIGA